MKVAIHQPQYLPWLGHFAKLAAADCWIFLDTVQYEKNGWQNRNRIKTPRGAQWLTVPVKARQGTLISDVEIDAGQPWQRKHVEAIRVNYARAPYFDRYFGELAELLRRPWRRLADLNVEVTRFLAEAQGLTPRMLRASELPPSARIPPAGSWTSAWRSAPTPTWRAGTGPGTWISPGSRPRGSPSWARNTSTRRTASWTGIFFHFCR